MPCVSCKYRNHRLSITGNQGSDQHYFSSFQFLFSYVLINKEHTTSHATICKIIWLNIANNRNCQLQEKVVTYTY